VNVTDLAKGVEVFIRSAEDICNRDRASVRLPNAAGAVVR
jgi:hypothetical protein